MLVMENVPQVHSQKNMPDFQNWLDYLESRGYKTYWQDLNAMNYGIPQSRNRCIAVSILGDFQFDFPASITLTTVMADYLETDVDDKYYVTSDKAKELIDRLVSSGKIKPALIGQGGKVSSCVTAEVPMKAVPRTQDTRTLLQPSCPEITRDLATTVATQSLSVRELGFIEKGTGKHQSNTVYGSDELSPTITAVSWKEPLKVIECQKIPKVDF